MCVYVVGEGGSGVRVHMSESARVCVRTRGGGERERRSEREREREREGKGEREGVRRARQTQRDLPLLPEPVSITSCRKIIISYVNNNFLCE